ncbi:MAG: YdcF family protein [Eubacteriales bacterium]|nr:YdcF family protein [Eubacteriales bacterium]
MKTAKGILVSLGIIILAVFVAPLFLHCTMNIGTLTGVSIGIALLIIGIWLRGIVLWIQKCMNKRVGKVFVFLCGAIMLLIFAVASVETVFMVRAATKNPEQDATVIVLGCRVYDGKPSKTLEGRLDAAYDYLIDHENAVCIVSGGKGSNENISEAACMYNYLVEKGIDENRIYMEDKSRTTRENLEFSKKIIEENGLNENIAIVTSEFHEYRAGLIAKDLDMSYGAISSKTNTILLPTYYVRELYGILYQWLGIGE